MAFRVDITPRAEHDLSQIYDYINADSSAAALDWYRRLKEAILSLKVHPYRCAVTPENKKLRHLLYGHKPNVYRVIYRVVVRQQRVEILHIRHSARRRFKTSAIRVS